MLIEKIDIATRYGGVEGQPRTVLALCDELWAVHPNGVDEDTSEPVFTVTHKPTGYALIHQATWEYALELVKEIRRRRINWAFTDPTSAKALAAEWKDIKASAQRTVGGVWPDELPPAVDAVDPIASDQGTPTTRFEESS